MFIKEEFVARIVKTKEFISIIKDTIEDSPKQYKYLYRIYSKAGNNITKCMNDGSFIERLQYYTRIELNNTFCLFDMSQELLEKISEKLNMKYILINLKTKHIGSNIDGLKSEYYPNIGNAKTNIFLNHYKSFDPDILIVQKY